MEHCLPGRLFPKTRNRNGDYNLQLRIGTDVKMRGCEDERMWRWADVKMRGCEDEMWRWEDVLQQRFDGSQAEKAPGPEKQLHSIIFDRHRSYVIIFWILFWFYFAVFAQLSAVPANHPGSPLVRIFFTQGFSSAISCERDPVQPCWCHWQHLHGMASFPQV